MQKGKSIARRIKKNRSSAEKPVCQCQLESDASDWSSLKQSRRPDILTRRGSGYRVSACPVDLNQTRPRGISWIIRSQIGFVSSYHSHHQSSIYPPFHQPNHRLQPPILSLQLSLYTMSRATASLSRLARPFSTTASITQRSGINGSNATANTARKQDLRSEGRPSETQDVSRPRLHLGSPMPTTNPRHLLKPQNLPP